MHRRRRRCTYFRENLHNRAGVGRSFARLLAARANILFEYPLLNVSPRQTRSPLMNHVRSAARWQTPTNGV